jgi:hypothetical protein
MPGDVEWVGAHETIGPSLTVAAAVRTDSQGDVYVGGTVAGALPGPADASPGGFLRRFDSSGVQLWARAIGAGTSVGDQVSGIDIDPSGIYAVGTVTGVLPGQVGAGGSDAFVRKYDADGAVIWTRQFGTASADQALGVAVDATGLNVVGFVLGALPTQSASGNTDAFVRRFDANGNELWTRQFGTPGADRAAAVATDATGIYVAGVMVGASDLDAFVRKYDLSGDELWTRQFGSVSFGTDQALAIAADTTGVYVAGTVAFSLPGQTSADSANAFVRKYDPDGVEIWTRQFTSGGQDQALGIAVNAAGVFVVGAVGGALPGQTSAGDSDAFVRRYDFNGLALGTHQFGSPGADRALAVASGPSAVHVAGVVTGTLPGQQAEGLPDAFLRTLDPATNTELWTRQFGTVSPQRDIARGVAVHGDVYVAGSYGLVWPPHATASGAFLRAYSDSGMLHWSRTITEGLGVAQGAFAVAADESGVYVVGTVAGSLDGASTAGSADAFVRKYDRTGHVLWTHLIGGASGSDFGRGVAVDDSGVYVVGSILPIGAGPPAVLSEAFVHKYSADGTLLWTRQFGTSGADAALAVSSNGIGVYVAGSVGTVLPGQSSAGGTDAFVRALDPDGNELWTAQFGTAGSDQAVGIAADTSGVYVVGEMGRVLATPGNAFIRKFHPAGGEVWSEIHPGGGGSQASGVALDGSGVYVSEFSLTGGLVRKLDRNGLGIWSRLVAIGTSPGSPALAVAAGDDGPYVAGATGAAPPLSGAYVAALADFSPVSIDIMPGEDPNTVKLVAAPRRLAVAILSTADFEAASVDPDTVTLAGAPVALLGNGSRMTTIEDVNGDGYPDLVLHVMADEMAVAPQGEEVELRGRTYDGARVRGFDAVHFIP